MDNLYIYLQKKKKGERKQNKKKGGGGRGEKDVKIVLFFALCVCSSTSTCVKSWCMALGETSKQAGTQKQNQPTQTKQTKPNPGNKIIKKRERKKKQN